MAGDPAMASRLNLRLILLLVLLLASAARQVAKEDRPSLLRPGLRMYAYVANVADGTVSAVDLVGLRTVVTIPVGPSPSGIRAHPTREEIWGVSTEGGFVWVIDAPTGQVAARIEVGAGPYAIDFSPDGSRAYVAASRTGQAVAIDCATRQVVARARVGNGPWIARVTPDGKLLVVPNRADNTVTLLDAETLKVTATLPVAPRPEQVVVLPDSSKAFVAAARQKEGGHAEPPRGPGVSRGALGRDRPGGQVSVIDLERRTLLANLPLAGNANDLVLKPDGGELYVPSPEAHSLTILNTWSNEVAEHLVVGYAPSYGTLTTLDPSDPYLYLSDSGANQITPIRVAFRRTERPIPTGQQPGVSRLTPGEDLLLVVNGESNDLAVIRTRTRSLITLVPVGRSPRDLAVKVF